MSLMDLQDTILTEFEIDQMFEILSEANFKLHHGAFLRLIEIDKIQGPSTKNESWLELFVDLTIFAKNK